MLHLFTFVLAASLSSAQVSAIENAVRGRMAAGQIPSVSVRVDIGGKNVYAKAFGYSSLTYRSAANVDTRYQYGSITKQFTGAAVVTLASRGKLSLDDRIGKWLPEFSKFPVTIRQMLVHTSGLPDYSGETWYFTKYYTNPFAGRDELFKWTAEHSLEFTPGEKAVYDNAAYTLLARVVEKASGEPFFTYLSRTFFKPLGMTSVAPQNLFKIEPNTAQGYWFMVKEFAEQLHVPYQAGLLQQAPPWNMEQVDGAGYLVGDTADLQKWDDALLAGTALTGKAKSLFHTEGRLNNGKPTYTGPENPAHKPGVYLYGGLGLFYVGDVPVYGANGGTGGFLSFTCTIPSKHLALTILTNHGADLDNSLLTLPVLRALVQ